MKPNLPKVMHPILSESMIEHVMTHLNDIKVDQSVVVIGHGAEIVQACEICKALNVAFVKTSTGFNKGGATVEDVTLMKQTVGSIGVKASGGVRDTETALAMITAGATRIGASAGIAIINGVKAQGGGY